MGRWREDSTLFSDTFLYVYVRPGKDFHFQRKRMAKLHRYEDGLPLIRAVDQVKCCRGRKSNLSLNEKTQKTFLFLIIVIGERVLAEAGGSTRNKVTANLKSQSNYHTITHQQIVLGK